MKYLHLHGFMFLILLIGLFIDSVFIAQYFVYSQWISNLFVLFSFIWVYQYSSHQVKQLMLFGLIVALGGEVLFSLVLGMYTYRLGNLPLYVPFGHSIIYAGVYYLAKEPFFKAHQPLIVRWLLVSMILYSTLWLLFANDVLGFICMLVILGIFKWREKTKPFFLLMFFTIVYLELLGTYFQCWYWPSDWFNQFSWVPSANPPSGISVFYFGFDAGCLWLYKKFNPEKWKRLKALKQRGNKQ
ncbi:MAG: hypothetical protein KAG28_09520 [Cocleimonas sp.]|nr:hypothetical protein [Cocleimonas sp.]